MAEEPRTKCTKCGSEDVRKISRLYHRGKMKESIKLLLGYDPELYNATRLLKDSYESVKKYGLLKDEGYTERDDVDLVLSEGEHHRKDEDVKKWRELAPPAEPDYSMSPRISVSMVVGGVTLAWCIIIMLLAYADHTIWLGRALLVINILLFVLILYVFLSHHLTIKDARKKYIKKYDEWSRTYVCRKCGEFFVAPAE